MRIIFMGSPDFAVPSLEILIEKGYNVVAVITATDKFGGRGGKKLIETPVKKCALKHNIPVLQPRNLKDENFVEELRSYQADLQIVVAFRMLPVVVWDMPPMGTYNLHGSLLPKYRGAAPINWAVINGEKETGVTSFKLKHAIDTGDYMLQRSIPIGKDETAGELYERMRFIGAEVVLDTVRKIEEGNIILYPQKEEWVSKAPKIYHETCEINWHQDSQTIYNFIRGMSPYPAAWTTLDNLQLNILRCYYTTETPNGQAGEFERVSKKSFRISTTDGYIYPTFLQLQGKRKMEVSDFLNGYHGNSLDIEK